MTKKKIELQPKSAKPKPELTELELAETELESAKAELAKAGSLPVFSGASQMEAAVQHEEALETKFGTEIVAQAQAAIVAKEAEAEKAKAEAEDGSESEDEPEFTPELRPPAKLERLQKILAQAGVASRRKAEEMIEQGRVQVNGKVVTVLGAKADAARDHIRVDGKLLHGSERLRYFVLNKPRGFVTTVKDPEGRPTVMQFFAKINERLYPVGRLDYMSEGLLLVTNDGELANRLTRAGSGIEKTYLVKVSGQPTEAELDLLRGGVAIERGKPGSDHVRTAPARIRQVRQGDNPWYEVVLIEGRNRELRKMFSAVGHFVEKIRRVGYGPLVLDQEPGHLRELEPEELAALRAAAEGKLRTPKSKELRRRNALDAQLPTLAPRPSRSRPARPVTDRYAAAERPGGYRAKKSFGADRPSRPSAKDFGSARPTWKKQDRPSTGKPYADRPTAARSYGAKPYPGKPYGDKPSAGRAFPAKPAWKKPEAREWPPHKRPPVSRSAAPRRDADEIVNLGPKTPSRLRIEPILQSDRPSPNRPFRGEGGLARPFTTSSGKPRAGGARPSSKPGKFSRPVARSYGAGPARRPAESKPTSPAKRPFRRDEGQGSFEPRGEKKTGWKPRPGGFSKSAYKSKPSGPRRTGAPGGKRRR
ncbi:MAG: pseudouridine synthase [Terracidiphilus sp.]|jgi:23S rRNA pseudouridine2605 synthase